jgi:DNA-binding NarL/FixJ family response regulator
MLTSKVFAQIPDELQDAHITKTEQKVIEKLTKGMTIKEISHESGVERRSISRRVSRVCQRLHATRYNLVYKAHLMGAVE